MVRRAGPYPISGEVQAIVASADEHQNDADDGGAGEEAADDEQRQRPAVGVD
jgi:hypothetical protein